ncbi:hypothetical protein KC865_01125 [Candidatus Kaiserbacteria bacterium]|nr:hypothetical protein [Candidatus Kaiserbacteria bacterium]USN92540.1 MAG: hypothetical protein H6782_01860 [Candidatus Nomurabacteria bacterium]
MRDYLKKPEVSSVAIYIWKQALEECDSFDDYAYVLQQTKLTQRSNRHWLLVRKLASLARSNQQIMYIASVMPDNHKDLVRERRELMRRAIENLKPPDEFKKLLEAFKYI